MQKNGKMLKCEACGDEVYIPLGRQKTFRFCSQSCFGKAVLGAPENQAKIKHPIGKGHFRWKENGTVRGDGYILISVNGKRYFQHRYVMETYLGRGLGTDETVHHINHNRSDNRLENLEVLSRSEHTIKYHKKQPYDKVKPAKPIMGTSKNRQ